MLTSTTNGRDDSTQTLPTPSQQRPSNGLLEEEDLLPLPESFASTLNNIVWPPWRKYLRHHTSDRVMVMTCIEEWSERARNLCFVAKGRMGPGNHEAGLLLDQLSDMVGDLEQIQEFGELTIGYDEAVRRAVDKARSDEENGSGAEAERPGAADTMKCGKKGESAQDETVDEQDEAWSPQLRTARNAIDHWSLENGGLIEAMHQVLPESIPDPDRTALWSLIAAMRRHNEALLETAFPRGREHSTCAAMRNTDSPEP